MITMDYESFDHITEELTKESLIDILEKIYSSGKNKEICFGDDMYIDFNFDEYYEGKASTYLELKNIYMRDVRTLDHVYQIVCNEFKL